MRPESAMVALLGRLEGRPEASVARISSAGLDSSRPEDKGVQLSEPSGLSPATPKTNAAKDLVEPARATVVQQSDSCTVGEATGVAANPLKSNLLDSVDSPDGESPMDSASDEPEWEMRI